MIVVVLLFFRSICLYLQQIVFKVHDNWLNPQHGRLYIDPHDIKNSKDSLAACRFCLNSPLGYCRHHNPNTGQQFKGSSTLNQSSSNWSLSSSTSKHLYCKCISCTSFSSNSSYSNRLKKVKTKTTTTNLTSIAKGNHRNRFKENRGFLARVFGGDDDYYNYNYNNNNNKTTAERRVRKIRTRI